jgi:ADP-ribosyl-[dinitrogen reductase] hydrolase
LIGNSYAGFMETGHENWHTGNFREAVFKTANLGGDADSTACVCGQIAGAFYGFDHIPKSWIENFVKKEMIIDMADRLCWGRSMQEA